MTHSVPKRRSSDLRQVVFEEKLRPFDGEPYWVRQIVLDKPDFWEYKLTAAILKTKLAPLHRQLMDLEGGLYVKKPVYIAPSNILDWLSMKFDETGKIAGARLAIQGMKCRYLECAICWLWRCGIFWNGKRRFALPPSHQSLDRERVV